jgi:O-methyltransferase involved in polyketide biosynthesis
MEKLCPDDNSRKLFELICGRAEISRKNGLIYDPKAEEIAAALCARGESARQGKYLSLYLGIRARVLDEIAARYIEKHPGCTVLHLGCGLDSRCQRLSGYGQWFDVDFPEVIGLRRRFYEETECCRMLGFDVSDPAWLPLVPDGGDALIIAEGLSMFLTADENLRIFTDARQKFRYTEYAFDAYTDRIVLYSHDSAPAERGKTVVWGLENPRLIEQLDGVKYIRAYQFSSSRYVRGYPLPTQLLYRLLYGRSPSNRFYRIYHYRINGLGFEEGETE